MILNSDGSLLCFAYNAVLRDSSRPFGFIPHSSIHLLASSLNDSVSSEGSTNKDKLGSTFRKIENLNMFAALVQFSLSFDDELRLIKRHFVEH